MKSKIQRGRALELRIERVFDQLNALPCCLAIRLEVRQARVMNGFIYCKKQPFDYLVISIYGVWAFDAKECSDKIWYPKHHAAPHQIASLKKMQELGHHAGFLVWFRKSGNTQSLRWIEDLENAATVDSGVNFSWEVFFYGNRNTQAVTV